MGRLQLSREMALNEALPSCDRNHLLVGIEKTLKTSCLFLHAKSLFEFSTKKLFRSHHGSASFKAISRLLATTHTMKLIKQRFQPVES